MRTLWGKRIKQPSGSGMRTESGQRSGRKERKVDPPPCVRFCQSHGTRSGPSLLRSGSGASRRALPANAAWPIPSRPGAQKPFWMIHKNWKSSGTGWKMRPTKMEIRPGLSANFQPGSRHRKRPPKLPRGREKGPSAVCINIQNIVNTGAGRRRPSGGSPCEKRNKLSIKRR